MPNFDFVLGGRYRLIGPLGEGGMASVYRARDLRLNREVAVKVLREELTRDPGFLARFEQEARFVASLSHPNIVPVYDVGEEDGSNYIVMEYVRGRTLKETLESSGPMPAHQAVAVMGRVLDALDYAHAQGLIHRDVKPHNILLTADGVPHLADFGIAHLADGSTTRTAAILGSAQYLSPEQSRGEEATARSDVYACGIVLYEMLTGRPPFDGSNALAIANQHLHATPPPLPTGRSIPAALQQAVTRALAKEPNDRFPDAASFEAALRAEQPATDSTTIQPLGRQVEATTIHPLAPPQGDLTQITSAPTAPRESEAQMVLRRSPRRTFIAAGAGAVLLVAVAYALQRAPQQFQLPQYPSAPYAAVPAIFVLIVILSWINARSWVYTMDTNAAVVQWGLFGHHRFGVPVRFITTLELKQSPIDRVLGVGTLELSARDQHGHERHLVLEDLPHPRRTYEDLMRHLGRTGRTRSAT